MTGPSQFDEGDDQVAPDDQRAEQPFQKIRLHRRNLPLDLCLSTLVARWLAFRRATCSSACFSVKPLSVRRLTNR